MFSTSVEAHLDLLYLAQDGCKSNIPPRSAPPPPPHPGSQEMHPSSQVPHQTAGKRSWCQRGTLCYQLSGWKKKGGGGGRKLQKNLVNGRFSCKCFWWFWGRSNETWMAKVNYVEDENVFDYNKNLDLSSLHNFLPQSRKTRFKLTKSFHHQCAKQWWRTQRTSLLSHLLESRALSAPTILVFSTFSRGSTDPCL